jgi:hypothetical protein
MVIFSNNYGFYNVEKVFSWSFVAMWNLILGKNPPSVTLESTGLFHTVSRSRTHAWFYSIISWSFGKFSFTLLKCPFQCWHIVSQSIEKWHFLLLLTSRGKHLSTMSNTWKYICVSLSSNIDWNHALYY